MPIRKVIEPVRFPVLPAHVLPEPQYTFLPSGYLITLDPEQIEAAKICGIDIVTYAQHVVRLRELKMASLPPPDRSIHFGLGSVNVRYEPISEP